MGWTFTNKDESVSIRKFFEKEFNQDNPETFKGEIIDLSRHGNEVYIAYKRTYYETGKEIIHAYVCLVSFRNKEFNNFGYKDMDESMHPYYYNCTKRILDLLSDPNDISDNESVRKNIKAWRNGCLNKIKQVNFARTVKSGDILKFSKPITFNNNLSLDTFKIELHKGFSRFRNDNRLYMIKDWRTREFTIVE